MHRPSMTGLAARVSFESAGQAQLLGVAARAQHALFEMAQIEAVWTMAISAFGLL